MKKKMFMKKRIMKRIAIATAIMSALMISACGLKESSLEQQVADALQANADAQAEEEKFDEPESALEYVDIETPDESAMTEPELENEIVEMVISEADNEGNVESTLTPEESAASDEIAQIVFMGDSIFDSERSETGIAYLVGKGLNADVYNLAIGGTTYALRMDKSTDFATWNEPNFLGVLYTMTGDINNGLLDHYKSGEVMKTLVPENTDLFIIEYGSNDFLSYIPMGSANINGQYYRYMSTSIEIGIRDIKEKYPKAKILICTPYYEEYWSADKTRYIGDCHTVNNGFGTLLDYKGVIENEAIKQNVPYIDMYDVLGITESNVNDMTIDGLHPSEVARRKYAELLIEAIKEIQNGEFDQAKWDPVEG